MRFEAPTNGSTDVSTSPSLYVNCSDNDSDVLSATWWYNDSDDWWPFGYNSSFNPSANVSQSNSNFSNYSATYYWSVNVTDGRNWTNATYHFSTRAQNCPDAPGSFTVSVQNRTKIAVSWTDDDEADATRLEWNNAADGSWDPGDHTLLQNDSSGSYTHEPLSNCTAYYYKAWSYNELAMVVLGRH